MDTKMNPFHARVGQLFKYLPERVACELSKSLPKICQPVNEIRLRVGQPVILRTGRRCYYLCEDKPIQAREMQNCLELLCDGSVYSRQRELSQGFLTLPGGHRVGVCGTAGIDSAGRRTVCYVSSINIRVAGEYIGCAQELLRLAFSDGICGMLIAGSPCAGKTTLLRDIALTLSSPPHEKQVTVVDERGEIAAMYHGEPQNRLGIGCDVLNGYPKGEGILIALRTLAPDVIICDEIGDAQDAQAIAAGVNAGVCIISSIHACNADELYRKESFQKLREIGAFEKIAFLRAGERCVPEEIVGVKRNGT